METAFDTWDYAMANRKPEGTEFYKYIHELDEMISVKGKGAQADFIIKLKAESHLAFLIDFLNRRMDDPASSEIWKAALPKRFDDWSFVTVFLIYALETELYGPGIRKAAGEYTLSDGLLRCLCDCGIVFMYRCFPLLGYYRHRFIFQMALRNFMELMVRKCYYREINKKTCLDAIMLYLLFGCMNPDFIENHIYAGKEDFIRLLIDAGRMLSLQRGMVRISGKLVTESYDEAFSRLRDISADKLPYCREEWAGMILEIASFA
jgi:hypothetical protein